MNNTFIFVENTSSILPNVAIGKFQGSDFCFISINEVISFKNHFSTIISLFELSLRNKIFSVGKNKRSDFYEQWQQHKQLKIDAWTDIYDEEYINQFR